MPNQTDALVNKKTLHLVRMVAGRVARTLPPSVDRDDLFQEGCIGLMQAASKFDPARKVPFWSFAYRRVRGAMLSSLRGRHWPENVHLPIAEAEHVASNESLDDEIEENERSRELNRGLKLLPGREERLLRLHQQGRHDGQIASEFGLCQNYVGALRRKALVRLRHDLRGLRRAA